MNPTAIARIELFHFSSPLPATFRPSWIPGFPQNENRCTLVRVVTADGVEGWSAGPAIGKERAGLGDLLGPYLIGEDATDIAMIQQRLREMSYLGLAQLVDRAGLLGHPRQDLGPTGPRAPFGERASLGAFVRVHRRGQRPDREDRGGT